MQNLQPEEMPRVKPEGMSRDLWDAFEDWADINGIGTADSDWLPWWHCYLAGSQQAIHLAVTKAVGHTAAQEMKND